MTIIVTGATGQYGRGVTRLLLERLAPEELILVTRKPEQLAALADRGVKVRHGDFDDPEYLAAAFEGGDRMLLISTARVGTRVGQHSNAMVAAADAGVRHVAYTSFIGLQPDNPALITRDHRATEAVIRASGTAWTFLRDGQYSEAAAQVIAPMVLRKGAWSASAGDGRIAMVSREDCVACAAEVLTTPGHENRAYDITGPELLSFRQISAMISEIAGKPLKYLTVTDDELLEVFDSVGAQRHATDDPVNPDIPWASDDMISFDRAIREGHFEIISEDVQTLIGRAPMPVREVLMKYAHTWPT